MRYRIAGVATAVVLLLVAAGQARSSGSSPASVGSREADVSHTMPGIGTGASVGYNNGPVLTSNRTHVIFWQPSGSHLGFEPGYRPLVERFLRDVATASHRTNNLFALTGQYTDSAGRPAAYASRYGGAVLDTDKLPPTECTEPPVAGPGWTICLTDAELQSEIEHVVHARHMPTTQRDVYFLVTPRGLGSCMGSAATSGCALAGRVNGYCGYHRYTNDAKVDYAFIPYNAVVGHCQSNNPRPNGSTADPALSTLAHELAETITDPNGDGWTDSSGQEIADLCITRFGPAIGGSGKRAYNENVAGGHFYLQELWSNASGSCQPRARPDHASFSVHGHSGRILAFQGSGTDPEGRILSYHWLFGDGHRASGRNVTHRYAARGSYPVRLRVTDSWGNWGSYARAVSVT
jgi:PKD domain